MATDVTQQQSSLPAVQYLRNTYVPTLMLSSSHDVDLHVAAIIEASIRENNAAQRPTVLGLATGSTPIGVYRQLIRLHKDNGLDFSRVITFNLDEYWPMPADSIHSYYRWMHETFFDHVNIAPENIHIPDGSLDRREIENACAEFERTIEAVGGIDIQILGIGRTGHIGFNEPGSDPHSRTRLVTLDPVTRMDASSSFFGEENVPLQAITMGIGTILDAQKIIMIALGEHKAPVIRRSVEGEVDNEVAASFLQSHENALFVLDEAAANDLTAVHTPWLVGQVDWTPHMEKRAVIWLTEQCRKPLLKLESRDFMEHKLHELLRECGPLENIRQRVFDDMLATICTEPAGTQRKTVIVFSPHPDDDVISMGGTLITLADQGHDVHIAYMTSGNIAVFDDDALRHVDYVDEFNEIFQLNSPEFDALETRMREAIAAKQPGDPDIPDVLNVKALIRKTEATAAAQLAGVDADHLEFLDMPFYRTGQVTKNPIGDDDIQIVADLLRQIKPDQIYVAGDLSDPHGTHRVCAQAILQALPIVESDGVKPEVWLYRGAWQEYEPHEIERAVPLSPEVSYRKKLAIFKHESQKDQALFPGSDEREFWERAEQRTKNTARIYNDLGLPEFYALEGFVRFSGQL